VNGYDKVPARLKNALVNLGPAVEVLFYDDDPTSSSREVATADCDLTGAAKRMPCK